MVITVKKGEKFFIVADKCLIRDGKFIDDQATTLKKMVDLGCQVIICAFADTDESEKALRDDFAKYSFIPDYHLLIYSNVESIYAICRQIEPKCIILCHADSNEKLHRFFANNDYQYLYEPDNKKLSELVKF